MRLFFLISVLLVAGCTSLPLSPTSLWTSPPPVTLRAVSYSWPSSLVVDAVNDAIIDEGGVIIRTEQNAGKSYVHFAAPHGHYIAEIVVIGPDSSTVTLTHPADVTPTSGITQGFFMAVDQRLGLR